ncbi:Uncharacterised protein [Shigella sonnei]|nr:Uncharacterised protein [Shigella sonnei]
MQQPERLLCPRVYWHCRFKGVITNMFKANIQEPHHVSFTHSIQCFQGDFPFPYHLIISSKACTGWRTPVPSTRFTWLRQEYPVARQRLRGSRCIA